MPARTMTSTISTTWLAGERAVLAFILGAFVLLGFTYALVTPAFEASDELWHYPMIEHLADGNPLPVQVFDPAQAGPWKQEASQPPLYYYLGAALTFWIDTSDMEQVRWLNPHVDNGVITPDGNTNLAIHDPDASPWQGTLLAVRIVRLASVLLGAATVYLTYRIARLVAPERPAVYLGAAAANAFTPMFLFISGAVNNDNLALPLASLAPLMIETVVQRRASPPLAAARRRRRPRCADQGGHAGSLPLAWGWASPAGRRQAPGRGSPALVAGAASTLPYHAARPADRRLRYARNIVLYGDPLGWSAFIAVLGERAQPASLAQLWDEGRPRLLPAFGVNANGRLGLPRSTAPAAGYPRLLSCCGWCERSGMGGTAPSWLGQIVARHFALISALLFRLPCSTGWSTGQPPPGRRRAPRLHGHLALSTPGCSVCRLAPRRAGAVVSAGVSCFYLASPPLPFLWIRPAYAVTPAADAADLQPAGVDFGDQMRLVAYDVSPDGPLHPGDRVTVTVAWEALAPMERDWSVFVHLNDPVLGVPLAQRDMYPGQGLLATRLMQPGQQVVDRYVRQHRAGCAPAN